MGFATLTPHPDFRCEAVSGIEVEVARTAATLSLAYRISGAIGGLAVPDLVPATRADELWRHTCLEAFVRPDPGDAYAEFNFAPSTQWAAYGFSGYREGMSTLDLAAPRIDVRATDNELILRAAFDLPPGPCRLALTAVIETTGGARSYWALAHPPGRPDFHHAAGFILRLPAEHA